MANYNFIEKDLREQIAEEVEDKMTYMCGCRNCIERVLMIIRDDMRVIDSQCDVCGFGRNGRCELKYEEGRPPEGAEQM